MRRERAVSKQFFSALQASVWSKNKRGWGAPLDPPLRVVKKDDNGDNDDGGRGDDDDDDDDGDFKVVTQST